MSASHPPTARGHHAARVGDAVRAHDPDHAHRRGHAHDHDHADDHDHDHTSGLRGLLHGLFVPHSHDPADSIDDALTAHAEGVRAVKISLVVLLATTAVQAVIVAFSGSVALLADTVHNFSDALTAIPLWIAFALSRRAATRKFTYGYNRAEDLAGLFILLMIALSAVVAAWQAVERMIDPQPITHIGWVIAAGVVGFAGNEVVAGYRIRVGRRIGSAALVADGVHARADGFTSLAVVLGGVGVLLGFPLADPLVGLLISAMIVVLLVGAARSVGLRLLDGVEPELVDRVVDALHHADGVRGVEDVRLRWIGHRLAGEATIAVADAPLSRVERITRAAELAARTRLPHLDGMTVRAVVSPESPGPV